jgi:type I restriction enzyme M protein
MNRTPDFNQFGAELWEIANVFRDDALQATERLETFSLFLFLKLLDEKEVEEEEELGRKRAPEEQLIPEVYRFHNWALDPDGYARSHGFQDSIEFCRTMFNNLAELDSKHPTAGLVRRLFSEHRFQLRYMTTVRALAIRLLKEFAEYFTPRHIVDRMIQIIDPQPGELIYDPACGTCGFIARTFEYVRDHYIARRPDFLRREQMLRDLKEKHLFAVEKVGLVYKLGLMNMILKADDHKRFESAKSWWATVEEIRKNDYNLTAGRYCPHQAEAIEHEKPEVLINRLLELEEEITADLQDLLAMLTFPVHLWGSHRCGRAIQAM